MVVSVRTLDVALLAGHTDFGSMTQAKNAYSMPANNNPGAWPLAGLEYPGGSRDWGLVETLYLGNNPQESCCSITLFHTQRK